MTTYRLYLLHQLLQLVTHELESHKGRDSLPLLLHRVASMISSTESLLSEIEACDGVCGMIDMSDNHWSAITIHSQHN